MDFCIILSQLGDEWITLMFESAAKHSPQPPDLGFPKEEPSLFSSIHPLQDAATANQFRHPISADIIWSQDRIVPPI